MKIINKNNKGAVVSSFGYIIMIIVSMVSTATIYGVYESYKKTEKFTFSTQSYYAAESGIEKGLLAYKKNPNIDEFQGEDAVINEKRNGRQIKYQDMNIYRNERVIKEYIPTGKSIQLTFDKDLDPNITRFHIAYLIKDENVTPMNDGDCNTPKSNGSIEISVLSSSILNADGINFDPILKDNNDMCSQGGEKTSEILTDPYSEKRIELRGHRCVLNDKGNTHDSGTMIEYKLGYNFADNDVSVIEDNSCNFSPLNNNPMYLIDSIVSKEIIGFQNFYTMIRDINYTMQDEDKIMLNVRAIDSDVYIMIWATDDAGNAYDIPGRYINFSATGVGQGNLIEEGTIRRLVVRKKMNKDLLPIFDYALFSESEFIK